MLKAAQFALSAVVVTIAGSCGRNMLQTIQIKNGNIAQSSPSLLVPVNNDDPMEVVERLQTMNRDETLRLFLASQVPENISDLEGEWDGTLLENNGNVMTRISNLMTHQLFAFGLNRRWAGKCFERNAEIGSNRFFNEKKRHHDTKISFDVSVEESFLQADTPSIRLTYSKYQPPVSLWKTMIDEVRFVPGTNDVLIGFGSMAWSGGFANGAPFCLRRIRKLEKEKSS